MTVRIVSKGAPSAFVLMSRASRFCESMITCHEARQHWGNKHARIHGLQVAIVNTAYFCSRISG